MNIGEISKLSGVNSKSIRRYEDLGIIPKVGRSGAGYRKYTETDVHLLRFVKRARELGFSMKDTRELVSLWRNKKRSSSEVKKLALKHMRELEEKVAEIEKMLSTLKTLVHHCHGNDRPECPILDGLDA